MVDKLSDLPVSYQDFISENTGRFKDFYSVGSSLGNGSLIS